MKKLLVFLLLGLCQSIFSQSISKYEYWFDQHSDNRVTESPQGSDIELSPDVSELAEGVHAFYFRAQDSKGNWSAPLSSFFLKTAEDKTNNSITRCEYWIDNDYSKRQSITDSKGVIDINEDVSSLPSGVHAFYFRAQDANGKWSAPLAHFFLKPDKSSTAELTQYEYWIDNNIGSKKTVKTDNGVVALDLDVSSLTKGVHHLTFRMQDSNQQWSVPATHFFVVPEKIVDDNKIVAYQYWFNDAGNNAQTVEVDPQTPFVLDTELTVSDVRKNLTLEDIEWIDENGQQVMVAKNVLFTRFQDAMGTWSTLQTDTFLCKVDVADLDPTIFIKNPDASNGEEGWTFGKEGYHYVSDYLHWSGENNPYFVLEGSADNTPVTMEQTVEGLPAGNYSLTFASSATKNAKLTVSVNEFTTEIPSYGQIGGDIWEDALPDSKEKHVNGGQGAGWGWSPQFFTTDGSPVIIKFSVMGSDYGSSVWIDDLKLSVATETSNISIVVKDADGVDITSQVTIQWKDADGNLIGNGNSLGNIVLGQELYYSILLNDELGRTYREVINEKVDTSSKVITCQLKRIELIKLSGRVSALDIDKTPALVSVVQLLNGKYEAKYSAQTDEKGEFIIDAYDDISDITISYDGYFDMSLHKDRFNGDGNLGIFPLTRLSGYSIMADLLFIPASSSDESPKTEAWTDGLNNIEFSLTNETNGTSIQQFVIQGINLIIKEGASPGDVIRVNASSKQRLFADATTTFTLVGDNSNMFTMSLIEYGGLHAASSGSNSANSIGLLYNSQGELVSRSVYVGDNLNMYHLPSGTYTLLSLMQSNLLGSIRTLSQLAAMGLTEGIDYLSNDVVIADGTITSVNVGTIPLLDETNYYYTTGNTYFTTSNSSVTIGNIVTLSARVYLKEQYANSISDLVLTIDLPEHCQLIENSVMSGTNLIGYSQTGNRILIPMTKDNLQEKVKLCVVPMDGRKTSVSASIEFDDDGKKLQPIGITQFDVKGLSIFAPATVSSKTITVSGTAIGTSEIRIYDNEILIGTTTSKADGTWTTTCDLYKAFNNSFHNLFAKVTTSDGLELSTDTRQIVFQKTANRAKLVRMLYYNPEFDSTYDIKFDLVNGTTTPTSYYYFPYKKWPGWWETYETEPKDFTFIAEFEQNDPSQIMNVKFRILTTAGSIRTIPATFDENQNVWVASSKFTQNRLPKNVTVGYEYVPEVTEEDRSESMLDQGANLAALASHVHQVMEEKATFVPISEDEQSVSFEMKMDGLDEPCLYRVEMIDFSEAEKMMDEHQFTYSSDKDGIVGTFFENIQNGISVVVVDITGSNAMRVTLTSTNNPASSSRRAKDIKEAIKSLKVFEPYTTFFEGAVDMLGALQDLLGVTEYLNVKSDFDNMCDLILRYNDIYLEKRQHALDAILAKCPDGSYKLSKEKREQWWNVLNALSNSESAFTDQYFVYLGEYKEKLWASVGTFIGTLGLGKGLSALGKTSKFVSSWANEQFLKILTKGTTAKTSADILTNLMSQVSGWVVDGTDKIFKYKDFDAVKDKTIEWAEENHKNFMLDYANIEKGVRDAYKTCEKKPKEDEEDPGDDEEEYDDDNNEFTPEFPAKPAEPMQDPSGYVYEAVLSNRLPGVTTTVYKQEGGQGVIWNAEDYSQKNPLVTDENGFYRWDVPMGNWQVKYEKDGYETTYSDWLPVPPPQLDVNVGLKQNTPPAVEQMRGFVSGISIDMSKYMSPSTLNKNTITVTTNGMATNGTIETLNVEKAPKDDAEFVSKVKFVPEMPFNTSDEVVVTIHKEVESYCGVQMTADHVETVKIEGDINDLLADSVVTVSYQTSKSLQVIALPKQSVAGKKLKVQSSSPLIASVDQTQVDLDADGSATFVVNGNLPGCAYLTFGIDNTDLSVQTRVKVVMDNNLVAAPQASIKSGETVAVGTQVVLTCSTEGATIYYTLDGSCPCDEATRIKYEAPIVISSGVIVKAIAVKDGMTDSDVATFVYVLDDSSNVLETEASMPVDIYYENGMLVIEGAESGICHVYDFEGRELVSRSLMGKRSSIPLPQTKGYIVSVQVGNSKALVRKVQIR